MSRHAFVAVAFALGLSVPVWAGDARVSEVEALEQAKQKLAEAEVGAGKPTQALIARQQRRQVERLLDQLEAGRPVDPAEVDRILRQAEHPY